MSVQQILQGWRFAAFKNGIQDATAYRGEYLIEVLGSAFVPAAIQWVLWYSLFKVGGAKQVAGMSYLQMVHYTVVSLLFSQIRGGSQDFEIQEMIRTGQLSNYLLRPISFLQLLFIRSMASPLLIALGSLLIGMSMSPWVGISPLRLLAAMGLALVGTVIHFLIGAALSTTAFLWEEAHSILMVKGMVVSFLSGELLPLNLFPPSLQWLWKSTPFYLFVFGPTQYALGHWTHVEFLRQLLFSLIWVVGCWGLVKLTWSLGIRRYVSLGG